MITLELTSNELSELIAALDASIESTTKPQPHEQLALQLLNKLGGLYETANYDHYHDF